MKRKLLSVLLTVAMTATLLVGCGGSDAPAAAETATDAPAAEAEAEAPAAEAAPSGDNVINLWAFTDEVPKMVDK
ncbi:MAG: carbohydrate ABC transporter substrate-binding protein, partial [Lachnospiraceae bacterium]|nr:carbohydrate ABC transporter substrate-binding protein [Lachnospiraceae bacterium]